MPVIDTDERKENIEANQSLVETFFNENCIAAPEEFITKSDFCNRFKLMHAGYSNMYKDIAKSNVVTFTQSRKRQQVRGIAGYTWKTQL